MRVPYSTIYFCGNCEEEVVGLPAGSRIASGRPLCLRCSQIGEEEGWGRPNTAALETRICEPTRKRGIILLLVLLAVVGAAYFVCSAVSGAHLRR